MQRIGIQLLDRCAVEHRSHVGSAVLNGDELQVLVIADRKGGIQTTHIFETPIFDLTTRKWVG